MTFEPPLKLSRGLRQTLNWLVPSSALDDPSGCVGEIRHILKNAMRLHESLSRLPKATTQSRCLLVGSRGLEAPYLIERLGWTDVTCVITPRGREGRIHSRVLQHPNGERRYEYKLLEHDLESGPMPFDDEQFGLVVCWGCMERLRYDPEYAMYEMNRVTEFGGRISVVTENAISIHATYGLMKGRPKPMRWNSPASDCCWRVYAPNEVADLLQGTGWRVDSLTTIVSESPIAAPWWKRWLLRRLLASCRRGAGMSSATGKAYIHADAVKMDAPTRSYPDWLYQEEKIRQLKVRMLELVAGESLTRELAGVG